MNTTIKLSVSSVLLAGLMTGCSQQQFQGGGQQIAGGQQILGGAGGQQILGGGGKKSAGGGQQILGGGNQVAGGQQILGGQAAGSQQILGGQQSTSGIDGHAPDASHLHQSTKSTEHSHNVEAQKRVYVPLPESMKDKTPAVFMYDQAKTSQQEGPVYYDDENPVYYDEEVQKPTPKPIQQHKPVVQHKGIGMPPAQPGQCFAKVNTPAKFKNSVKRVQVSPAVNKRVKVRGPQYTWVTKKVLARPATQRNQYIPAQYRNVTKKVLVKPAHYAWQKGKTGPVTRIDNMTGEILCLVTIPAVYKTVTQKVIARPAKRIKRNIPAVYRTVKEKKLASPAVYRTIKTPARFVNKTYRVQTSGPRQEWKRIICKTPNAQGSAVQRTQPAKRKHVQASQNAQILANQQRRAQHAIKEKQRLAKLAQQRKLAQQARQRQVQIAKQKRMAQHEANQLAQRKTKHAPKARPDQQKRIDEQAKQQKALVRQASHAPKQALQTQAQTGDDNSPLTRANAVFRIQQALQQRGFNPGPVDGKLGPATVKALTAFQETKGLKTGTLNRDTLRALNLVQ